MLSIEQKFEDFDRKTSDFINMLNDRELQLREQWWAAQSPDEKNAIRLKFRPRIQKLIHVQKNDEGDDARTEQADN